VAQFGCEIRNPWDDVRLVEFLLSIPEEQIARGINHKLIVRRAMQGLLPASVRERRGLRTGPGLYIEEGLRHRAFDKISRLFSHSRAQEFGFIDAEKFRKVMEQFRAGKRRWSFSLWMVLSLEMWLREHFSFSGCRSAGREDVI